jgi:hypothetical protein
LNGLTAQVQNFATGTSGTDFGISSATNIHTFNLPTASATNRGALSSADWTSFNGKVPYTGATTNVDLGDFVLTSGGLNIDALGGSGGALNLRQATGFSLWSGAPYTSIYATTGNRLIINFSNDNRTITLDGSIVSASTPRTFTFPDATGTLALTSQIPANPLGGTGTSGRISKFTGTNTIGDSDLENIAGSIYNYNATAGQFAYQINGNTSTGLSFGALVYAGTNSSDTAFECRNLSAASLFKVRGDGLVTLTGALNGTTANFSGNVGINTATPDIIGYATKTFGILGVASDFPNMQIGIPGTSGSTTDIMGDINFFSRNGTGAVVSRSLIRSGLDGATTNNYFSFFTMNAGTLAERLKIASNGSATFSGAGDDIVIIGKATAGQNAYLQLNAGSSANAYINSIGSGKLILGANGAASNHLTILSTGNVGIGTASPGYKLTVGIDAETSVLQTYTNGTSGANQGAVIRSWTYSTENYRRYTDIVSIGNWDGTNGTSAMRFFTQSNSTTPEERMRITSGGEVLVGTQTTDVNTVGCQLRPFGLGIFIRSGAAALQLNRTSSDGIIASFRTSDIERGSISIAGSVTSYNVTSDYRLKEDFQEVKGLEKVGAIKVYDYKWKLDEKRMDGVLAHELAEVLPYAVFGEKDEVDENGNDQMQSVDYSKIVPILIKAIQELKTEIDSLKNQIK